MVTPFRAQANRIRTLVHQDRDLANRLAAAQFVVDTVHGFQGDERDVIFFSPVVSRGCPRTRYASSRIAATCSMWLSRGRARN